VCISWNNKKYFDDTVIFQKWTVTASHVGEINNCGRVMTIKVCKCQMSGTDGKAHSKRDGCHWTIGLFLWLEQKLSINFRELLNFGSPFLQLCTLGDNSILAHPSTWSWQYFLRVRMLYWHLMEWVINSGSSIWCYAWTALEENPSVLHSVMADVGVTEYKPDNLISLVSALVLSVEAATSQFLCTLQATDKLHYILLNKHEQDCKDRVTQFQ
jgi:hypothetical protein